MAKATQFCVCLSNKPGTLAKLSGALKRAKVNIEAISVADNSDCCCVRLVASSTPAAKKALTTGKFNFCTQRVLAIQAPNKPGALEAISAKLAKARVNINYVYGSTGKSGTALVVLGVDDLTRAAKVAG